MPFYTEGCADKVVSLMEKYFSWVLVGAVITSILQVSDYGHELRAELIRYSFSATLKRRSFRQTCIDLAEYFLIFPHNIMHFLFDNRAESRRPITGPKFITHQYNKRAVFLNGVYYYGEIGAPDTRFWATQVG